MSSPNAIGLPLKYKFLSVILLVVLAALSVFWYVAQQTFSEDKKLFIMDSNRTLLKAATSEVKLELKGRLEELQSLIPRIHAPGGEKGDVFLGMSPNLVDEFIGVTFYRTSADGQQLTVQKQYTNKALTEKQKLPLDIVQRLNQAHPVTLSQIDKTQGVDLVNRSLKLDAESGGAELPVLSFVMGANFINDPSKELFIVVDFVQTFLMRTLAQSELTEVFLLFTDGRVLSHPNQKDTVAYAKTAFPHPVVDKLKERKFTRESLELDVNDEEYLCNISETGFKNVFAVSQIRKAEAFLALRTLMEKSLILAFLILSAATVVSVFFASGLTTNIQKLRAAAEQLGAGNLDIQIKVTSNDEIKSVAHSFQWMANRIQTLIEESTEKARLADELETARLVQSTLLTPPSIESPAIEMDSHYLPATECGGDYWDARVTGNLLTVFIGDATGHGAPAAIVTAVAKSCFATLSTIYANKPLPPEKLLAELNSIIYGACRGKLLMTMCIVQLNLETGDVRVANAGHESPLCLRKKTDDKAKPEVDVFFSRGERLGFTPDASYEAENLNLNVGDTVLLYTDGISEARSEDGKEFGERALKKAMASGEGLPPTNIKDRITEQLQKHTMGAEQADDITFVLFRWKTQLAGTPTAKAGTGAVAAVKPVAQPKAEAKIEKVIAMPPKPPSTKKAKQPGFQEVAELREALDAGIGGEKEEPRKKTTAKKKPKAA